MFREVSLDGGRLYASLQDVGEFSRMMERPPHPSNAWMANELNPERLIGQREYKHKYTPAWWGGFKHSREAGELLSKGWAAGYQRIRKLQSELAADLPSPTSRRRRSCWAEDGDSLDPDRAMAGQWDTAYRVAKRQWAPGSTSVDIAFVWGGDYQANAEELFWTGAATLAAAEVLEEAGYNVRLVAISAIASGVVFGAMSYHGVVIKDAEEPMRPDALAAIACHAGIFRTLGLRAHLLAAHELGPGCGKPRQNWPSGTGSTYEALMRTGILDAGAITVGAAYTKERAREAAQQILKQVAEANE